MLYQSIHQGSNVNTTLMEGFSVKTLADIRFVKDSHLFVKDYSISVTVFEINESI